MSKSEGHLTKIAHINNLKDYVERIVSINAVTFVAEDMGIGNELLDSSPLLSKDICPGFNKKQLDDVLSGQSNHFSETPGLCTVQYQVYVQYSSVRPQVYVHKNLTQM